MANSDITDRRGIHIAAAAFEALGFAFREQTTSDFGIDAHLEPRDGPRGTGDLIAVQVKSGTSYFREATNEGWWLRTDNAHAEYWLRHALPVIVVQVDVEDPRVFWALVTNRTVRFTERGVKILIPRDCQVDVDSLPALREILSPGRDLGEPAAVGDNCRVFLGRGISGREGWSAFARILVGQGAGINWPNRWDIVVDARTGSEDDDLTDTNEYGDLAEDLVSINVDVTRHRATYCVSSQEIDDMDLLWNIDCRAEAAADAIIQHLMAAEGMLDDDVEDDDDEDDE